MNRQCKVKVWSCRLAKKTQKNWNFLFGYERGDQWVLLVFTEKREWLHTSLYNLLHSLTGEMALSFSLGAAESPWGFYSPPRQWPPHTHTHTHTHTNFPLQLAQQVGLPADGTFCLSGSACYQETCFLPRRSLSSIITGGGLENDSGGQLQLTVWGLNVNSTLLGKQGWWWPLLPKVCSVKKIKNIYTLCCGPSSNSGGRLWQAARCVWLFGFLLFFLLFFLTLI